MNYKDLQNILVCPVCRTGLAFQEQEAVCTNCGTSYAVKDRIPVLKPPKAVDNALSMDYHDHYEVDAKYSDYFAPRRLRLCLGC
ncbi:MAG: Trm112 family protein [FCB group bacterium]